MITEKRPAIKKRKSFTRWIKRMTAPRVSPLPSHALEQSSKHGVFSVPLTMSISYARATIGYQDADQINHQRAAAIPLVVAKCGSYLKRHGLETEGCFRLQGNMKRVNHLQHIFDSPACSYGLHHIWQGYTIHDIGNVLRRFLLQLPDPVIPFEFYKPFRDVMNDKGYNDTEQRIDAFQGLIRRLPTPHQHLLLYMLDLLRVFATNAASTRMDAANLATVFSPGLLHHPSHSQPIDYKIAQRVIEFLIEFQPLFSMDLLVDEERKPVDPEELLQSPQLQRGSLRSVMSQPTSNASFPSASTSNDRSTKKRISHGLPPVPALPTEWLHHNNNTDPSLSASRSAPTPAKPTNAPLPPAPHQPSTSTTLTSPLSPPISPTPNHATHRSTHFPLFKKAAPTPPTPQASFSTTPNDTPTSYVPVEPQDDDDNDDCPTPRPASPVTSPTSPYHPFASPTSASWPPHQPRLASFQYQISRYIAQPSRILGYGILLFVILVFGYEGHLLYTQPWIMEPYNFFIGLSVYVYLLLSGMEQSQNMATIIMDQEETAQMYRLDDGFIYSDDDDDRYSQQPCADGDDGLSLFDDASMLDHNDDERMMIDDQEMENWQHLLTRAWRAPPDMLDTMAKNRGSYSPLPTEPSSPVPLSPVSPQQQVYPALGQDNLASPRVADDDDLMSVASTVSRFDDGLYDLDHSDDEDDEDVDDDGIASLASTELESLWLRYQQFKTDL
ncbi:RhoGAP-domain-containing protein [Hesseltinella vesiculosa]|uniref:RhoGAP-domain-containing protein n=1 Tax=Hesseltinella vesiculosa TaxID=101127 RepID=A0A1X2GTS2_9FUNG|nr:RhoGAP-domain-containing protein [Hesseltinella vesiculosa]